jgi:small redox-active disulfide protein 2
MEMGKMDIKVLGPGCTKCKKAEEAVREALAETTVQATVEKVTDMMAIAGYGVMATPAVVVDGDIKCVGKVPKKEEILSWLGK